MVFFSTGSSGGTPVTVTVIEADLPPAFAVILAVPAFTGVTVPSDATFATASLEEDQETFTPAGSVVAVSLMVFAPLVRSVVKSFWLIFTEFTVTTAQLRAVHVPEAVVSPFQA